ncbi:MAG: hypothetical protein ACR2MT_06965 [Aurantibacter sp.]
MKNSTLVFRSLAIVIFIAGIAHLFTYASQKAENKSNISGEEVIAKTPVSKTKNNIYTNENTNNIIGQWKVTYDSNDYKGSIIYEIKKEGKVINAYTIEYQDENGYGQKADRTKTLIIKSFDGQKGKGVYMVDYENEKYDVKCDIAMVDENTFKLRYDYYGHSNMETWKRR